MTWMRPTSTGRRCWMARKRVHTAYSRLPGQPKVYVQDILQQQLADQVLHVLHQEQGHLYVCGDMHMARDVAHTLKQLVAARLSLSEEQVEDYCFQLKMVGFGQMEPHVLPRQRKLCPASSLLHSRMAAARSRADKGLVSPEKPQIREGPGGRGLRQGQGRWR
uniref:Nitric oxide synthase, inducible n=1 Tax=Myotis myotis TaxID=51298 RepID=A0A7J7T643_MYOMY|nr:hypothetical protein mMyoMyo1_009227 [Myotis myotis]